MGHLCESLSRSENTLRRWIKRGPPTEHDRYKLALACGLDDERAYQLSLEGRRFRAKETA